MRRYSTLDFVVKDEANMMALLHVTGRQFYNQADGDFLRIFRFLKMKMKMGYECWLQGKDFKQLVIDSINKSIEEKLSLASAQIQKCINVDDGVPEYNNSEDSVDLDAVYEQRDYQKKVKTKIAQAIQHLKKGTDIKGKKCNL